MKSSPLSCWWDTESGGQLIKRVRFPFVIGFINYSIGTTGEQDPHLRAARVSIVNNSELIKRIDWVFGLMYEDNEIELSEDNALLIGLLLLRISSFPFS